MFTKKLTDRGFDTPHLQGCPGNTLDVVGGETTLTNSTLVALVSASRDRRSPQRAINFSTYRGLAAIQTSIHEKSRYNVESVRFQETMSTTRIRTILALLSASALGAALLLGVPSAGAATYCGELASVGTIGSPALPASDSFNAMSAALLRLPGDINALHADHVKLLSAESLSPNAVATDFLRRAISDVVVESAALNNAVNQELNVVLGSVSSTTLMTLAKQFVVASNAAASANAFLSAERTISISVCP
jgi:hypothetical protein